MADPGRQLTQSEVTRDLGLTDEEAALRLADSGPNELPSQTNTGLLGTFVEVLKEPMLLLLVAIGAVYAVLGEPSEAVTMCAAVLVVLLLTIVQERRTAGALSELRNMAPTKARVYRSGSIRTIERSEVVPGDLVYLSEGERVPADGIAVTVADLTLDESALTGESVPVIKQAGSREQDIGLPGGDATPFLFSGTLVVKGHGTALVKRTGARTEFGRIGASLLDLEVRTSPLHKESRRIVFILGLIGALLCLLATLTYGIRDRLWGEGVLAGLTMAISIVPEEIPVVFTILMALGAWRIAKSRVLTRRLPAIETLGAATTLCVDKTGTLTQNSMAVAKVIAGGREFDFPGSLGDGPEALHQLIRYSVLASQVGTTDPTERALWDTVEELPEAPHTAEGAQQMLAEFGLTSSILAVSYLWQRSGGSIIVATKGAPEAVASLCGLDGEELRILRRDMQKLAGDGLRVLAVAAGEWRGDSLPAEHRELKPTYLGLVGLADPVREGVVAAIEQCRTAGIRVVMLTGDHQATATSIARKIGLSNPNQVMTGSDLALLSESELHQQVSTCSVYARIQPDQKLRLVQALQASGEIVAMTGDGVNDAPALRAADIGIAMGKRGTDVAREAADLVLLDDDFSSIVRAIRLGRRTFDNLRHAISYIVAVHVPIGGLTILPVLFNMPLILLPLHIVLLEMTVDPACATVFEAEAAEGDLMIRPPRSKGAGLIDRAGLRKSIVQGAGILMATFGSFLAARAFSGDVAYARTISFGVLIVANLTLIAVSTAGRKRIADMVVHPSKALAGVVIGSLLGLLAFLLVPALRGRAHFAPTSSAELAFMFALGIGCVLWLPLARSFTVARSVEATR